MSKFSAQIDYKNTELIPYLSEEEINFHYGKHHVGYANTLNDLIAGTKYENLSLDEIIRESRGHDQKIFNNASQLFNHNFYWKCLKRSTSTPQGKFLQLINDQFGSLDNFQNKYVDTAVCLFGSGWSWLIEKNGKLDLINTQNSEIPHEDGVKLVCVLDVWEHAYYIDYRNDRRKYLNEIVKNCVNWEFCESRLG